MDQQFSFQETGNLHHSIIIFSGRFAEFSGIDGNARIDIVVQGEHMTFEGEIPHQGIKIVSLVIEINIQIIRQDISDFVKTFSAAIVIYNCFGTAEVCA